MIAIDAQGIVKSEDDFTVRDIAVACELWQRYIDLLDEMIETIEIKDDETVVVKVQSAVLKLPSVEQLAEWINHGDEKP